MGAGWDRCFLLVGQQDLPRACDDITGLQEAGNPEEIISGVLPLSRGQLYDIAPNGKRFDVAKADEEPSADQYRVVVNWIEEVKARMGQRP